MPNSEIIEYAKHLCGISYHWWNPLVSCCESIGPFWAEAGPEVPYEYIVRGGLNCAGFLNVICRKFNLPIPGSIEKHIWAGGTYLWWDYFEKNNMIVPYNENTIYKPGTILLRPFKEAREDEGHIAIVYNETQIIHCWPEKGVVIEAPMRDYYEVAVIGFL